MTENNRFAAIVYGHTPKGIKKIQIQEIAKMKNMPIGDLCESISTMAAKQKIDLLIEFYCNSYKISKECYLKLVEAEQIELTKRGEYQSADISVNVNKSSIVAGTSITNSSKILKQSRTKNISESTIDDDNKSKNFITPSPQKEDYSIIQSKICKPQMILEKITRPNKRCKIVNTKVDVRPSSSQLVLIAKECGNSYTGNPTNNSYQEEHSSEILKNSFITDILFNDSQLNTDFSKFNTSKLVHDELEMPSNPILESLLFSESNATN